MTAFATWKNKVALETQKRREAEKAGKVPLKEAPTKSVNTEGSQPPGSGSPEGSGKLG